MHSVHNELDGWEIVSDGNTHTTLYYNGNVLSLDYGVDLLGRQYVRLKNIGGYFYCTNMVMLASMRYDLQAASPIERIEIGLTILAEIVINYMLGSKN